MTSKDFNKIMDEIEEQLTTEAKSTTRRRSLFAHPYLLTVPESELVLWLLMKEQESGDYIGNKEHYYARRDRLIEIFTIHSKRWEQ